MRSHLEEFCRTATVAELRLRLAAEQAIADAGGVVATRNARAIREELSARANLRRIHADRHEMPRPALSCCY